MNTVFQKVTQTLSATSFAMRTLTAVALLMVAPTLVNTTALMSAANAQNSMQPSQPALAGGAASANQAGVPVEEGSETIISSRSLLDVVHNGGPLMIPIGICSFILLVFVFERFIALRKGRIIPRPFVRRFLKQLEDGELDRDKALQRCEENPSPVSHIFAAAIQKWGRPSVEVEQAIIDSGERVTTNLKKHLRLINGVATVCPLLGLLGTVLGMIQAFDAIGSAAASADPKMVIAIGISQALLTTAAGLSVAIPALIAYMFFVGRVDRLVIELDALGQTVVNLVSSDAIRPTRTRKASKAA